MDYNKVIKLNSNHTDAYYNLSCAYSQKKDIQNSIKYLNEAIEKGFTDYNFMETDSQLNNIRHTKKYEEIIQRMKK